MPKLITARCQACGIEAEVEWTRGKKCPRCGSDKFFPVVRIDQSAPVAPAPKARAKPSENPVRLILAVLVFVAAISAFLYRVKQTSTPKVFYKTSTMICTNPDCGKTFQLRLKTSEVFPKKRCPYCKMLTGFRAVQCRNCLTIFGLDPDRKPDPTTGLKCPQCGSQDINFDSSSLDLEQEERLQ
jgi:DNA-directed RNA polymerase subunit RPC12/RpoP